MRLMRSRSFDTRYARGRMQVLLLQHMLRGIVESAKHMRRGICAVMRRVADQLRTVSRSVLKNAQEYRMILCSDDPVIDILVNRSYYALGDEITTVASGY